MSTIDDLHIRWLREKLDEAERQLQNLGAQLEDLRIQVERQQHVTESIRTTLKAVAVSTDALVEPVVFYLSAAKSYVRRGRFGVPKVAGRILAESGEVTIQLAVRDDSELREQTIKGEVQRYPARPEQPTIVGRTALREYFAYLMRPDGEEQRIQVQVVGPREVRLFSDLTEASQAPTSIAQTEPIKTELVCDQSE